MNALDYTPLRAYLQQWVRRQPYGWHQRRPEDIANEWINDLAFTSIQLARWLRTPEAETITALARTVLLPYPANQAVSVLIEAIQIAARQRTNRQIAATTAGGLALAGLIYLALQN